MKIVKAYPPNYSEIIKHLPGVRGKKGLIFAYGDTIFNPQAIELQSHHLAHEEVHERQQKDFGGVELWWKEYLRRPRFRFIQEVEAYSVQYRFLRRNITQVQLIPFLRLIAKDLASPIYGGLMSVDEAMKEIISYPQK